VWTVLSCKQCHAGLHKHTSEGSAVVCNAPSDISEQTTEGSEDDPVSQRSQGSSDDHEVGLPIVETYSMAAVCIRGVRMKPLVTHIIVSDVGEAVFTRPRQH